MMACGRRHNFEKVVYSALVRSCYCKNICFKFRLISSGIKKLVKNHVDLSNKWLFNNKCIRLEISFFSCLQIGFLEVLTHCIFSWNTSAKFYVLAQVEI